MMDIYLIRHGQTDANVSGIYQGNMDVPLNNKGLKQAELVAWRLRQMKIDQFYVSHLKRARDTAKFILEYHDITPVTEQDLQEISLGEWQGKTRADVKSEYADYIKAREDNDDAHTTPFPGGESFASFEQRAVQIFYDILDRGEQNQNIVIVTHGGIIKALVRHILDFDPKKGRDYDVFNTSITRLRYDKNKDRLKLVTLNDVAHL